MEAVGVGVVGAEPAIAQGHKEIAPAVAEERFAEVLGHGLELVIRPERLLRQVLPPLQPAAVLVQRNHKAAPERADRATAYRLQQADLERRVRRGRRLVLQWRC